VREKTPFPVPEKARLLKKLKTAGFNVPDFIFVPPESFVSDQLSFLESFLENHRNGYKVIARSAHPMESYFKGGTFDSLETYADREGIKYARNRIINMAQTAKRLSILRQQQFLGAPEINLEDMGVVVMPFIDGASVMAKRMGIRWEFGYCRDRNRKIQCEPYITQTPHDIELFRISERIEAVLGFKCEIEFIISSDNVVYVVQAKDISKIEVLEKKDGELSIRLDGIRRIRLRRNYRERPILLVDNKGFYMEVIDRCEEILNGKAQVEEAINQVLEIIHRFETEMEVFCLKHQRFGIIDLSDTQVSYLYQIANHYLEEHPEAQKKLSKALYNHQYKRDAVFMEADTFISQDTVRINLSSHDAYGIDTVRVPIWTVYWNQERHQEVVRQIHWLGFKTGDTIAIEIDVEDRPTLYRL
jgi:hypothetical protein